MLLGRGLGRGDAGLHSSKGYGIGQLTLIEHLLCARPTLGDFFLSSFKFCPHNGPVRKERFFPFFHIRKLRPSLGHMYGRRLNWNTSPIQSVVVAFH